jgi:hypothetical protein
MLLTPSDPDIQTIVTRIGNGDLDLQPDFQRGEVWSTGKKKRLIDSILRNWHVPPIHTVVVPETGRQEVLDGQQRLAAIRDFVAGEFTVDGSMPPQSSEIGALGGKFYTELPENVRRRFDAFTIRIIRITDYAPEEPGELFYRLNQITNITAAEQRNAFFGPVRQQIKDFVIEFERLGNDQTSLGFSNSRMAYDDVLSKLLCTVEAGTLNLKLTASVISDRFRERTRFGQDIFDICQQTVELFSALRSQIDARMTFNKATLLSWLIFVSVFVKREGPNCAIGRFSGFMEWFERARLIRADMEARRAWTLGRARQVPALALSPAAHADLLEIFNDRSTSRVLDVSSVVYRDVALNVFFSLFSGIPPARFPHLPDKNNQLEAVMSGLRDEQSAEKVIEQRISLDVWGPL